MSMNLHLEANVDSTIHYVNGDVNKKYSESFRLWQTPTHITNEALKFDDPYSFYKSWVMTNCEDKHEPVYADDDCYEETPIRYEVVNYGETHIKELSEWIEAHKYYTEIIWYAM